MAKELVYQLKISLVGTKPMIWRTVLVPAEYDVEQLHDVIQSAFAWENSHLYQFTHVNMQEIYMPDFERKAKNIPKIKDILEVGEAIFYTYDMGDNWEHQILCEGLLIRPKGKRLPCCIDGAMNHAFEDVGGVWGYQDMLKVLKDPSNPEHKEQLDWIIEGFGKKILKYDQTAFDIKKIKF